MNKTKSTSAVLALVVALPNFITPVIAAQNNTTNALPASEKRVLLAQAKRTKKAEPAELKRLLTKQLAEMTPAQKKEIGQSRINQLSALSGDEIARGGCFTQGVGCQGTSGFTSGVVCCVIIKTGI